MPDRIGANGEDSGYKVVRDESVRGASVGGLLLIAKAVVGFGSLVVLARLLVPEDFGLVAMAAISIGVFRVVGDFGLVMSTTQRREIDEAQLSTLFWINVVGGLLLCLLAIASAPGLVAVFGESRLLPITSVLSLVLIGSGIGAQHEAILRRRLDYSYLQAAGVVAQAIGLLVGVVCALSGWGYWSLVLHQLVGRSSQTALFWARTRWWPGRPQRGTGSKSFLGYGGQMMVAQLLAYATRSFGDFMVGVAADATSVGFFRRANSIVMVVEELKQPLKAIMPASLSRMQHEPFQFAHFLLNGLALWSLGAFAALGLIAAEAPLLVDVLLGDEWEPVAPLIRWLVPAGLAAALGSATEWILMPLGMMKRLVAVRVLRLLCVVAGILVGWTWGVNGIAVGYSVSVMISLTIELWWVMSVIRARSIESLWSILRPAVAAATAGLVVFVVQSDGGWLYLVEIFLYGAVFLISYAALPGGFALLRRVNSALGKAIESRARAV